VQEVIAQLLEQLKSAPQDSSYRSAIPEDVTLKSFSCEEEQVVLDFDQTYQNLSPAREVLTRAAIVRTLCQVPEVNYVSFSVEGEPLLNQSGNPVGMMTQEQFIDNAGTEINAYEKVSLTLYFADESGTGLQAHTVECVYNSNISLDKLVVEQLVEGPEDGGSAENGYATMAPGTQIISVTTRDNVCYVNLGEDFMSAQGSVTPEVTIYSIVNSLAELSTVNKVQILINGDMNLVYKETIPLSQVFERNLEIIDIDTAQ
jgi:germination protein M